MLRITMNTSASGAKKYYSEAYYQEGGGTLDYYAEKEQGAGRWGGKGADHLGLTGSIDTTDFAAMCDNIDPRNGNTLTGRKNQSRTVGYDFTFNANKSVSLAFALGNDDDKRAILTAFNASVQEAMEEVERGMQARVRVDGKNENRLTGNIAYGAFTHFTTRPIDGVSDPHLHSHCFVFNATFDDSESKWKAGQFRQINQDAPYYEAFFHSLFANKLQQLGFQVQKTDLGFELAGVGKPLIDRYSRRSKEIDDYAAEHGITDAAEKSRIGAKTREAKRETLTPEQQQQAWLARLSPDELRGLQQLRSTTSTAANEPSAQEAAKGAVQFSLSHHLERKSVTSDKEILATAIKSAIGKSTPSQAQEALKRDQNVLSVEKNLRCMMTTKEALREEKQLIAAAARSKNSFRPIDPNYEPKDQRLNHQQRKAVKHILSSTDGIIVITGKAGTGKTTLMLSAKEGIHAAEKQIFSFAPSSEASRGVQRREGFSDADTVASLIQDTARHAQFKNQVIWVDEAGMLSNRDMNQILAIAQQQSARVILSGDTKQHTSVMRGDALRILQQEAGIRSVTVDKIQRQQNAAYREAVAQLSAGNTEKGFAKLEQLGAIHEITDSQERTKAIAQDYYHSTYGHGTKEKNVLVVSPTHAEGDAVTKEIRHTLKEQGKVSHDEHSYTRLKNLQFTEAQKQSPEHYHLGQEVVFHQHAKGIKAGSRLSVTEVTEQEVKAADKGGLAYLLPLHEPKKFSVYEPQEIGIAQGDKIRLTKNGKSMEGVNLYNSNAFRIEAFDEQGNIKLSNGSTLAKDFGHFNHGYVMTSHNAQGQTADKVIVSQSMASMRAASMEQFYVSVSRAREAVAIYTDDKNALAESVAKSSARISASELMRERTQQQEQSQQRTQQTQKQEPQSPIHHQHPMNHGFSPTHRTEQEHAR